MLKVYEVVCLKLEPQKIVGTDQRSTKDVKTQCNEVFDENYRLIENANSVD